MLAFRKPAGPCDPVVLLDVIPFRALVVVVIDTSARKFRVERGHLGHVKFLSDNAERGLT